MSQVTVDLVRRASRRYLYNKKYNIPNTPPTKDFWGNDLPTPPPYPFRFVKPADKKER